MTPLDLSCPYLHDGFHCGAEPGMWCTSEDGRELVGFHEERIALTGRPQVSHDLGCLTPAQKRVLALLVDGHTQESAASQLGIAPSTVNRHVDNINERINGSLIQATMAWFYQTYYEPKVAR